MVILPGENLTVWKTKGRIRGGSCHPVFVLFWFKYIEEKESASFSVRNVGLTPDFTGNLLCDLW